MSRLPAIVLLLSSAISAAEDGGLPRRTPDLRLKREPSPRTLRMRRPVAQVQPAPAAPRAKTPMPAAPMVLATATAPIEELEGLRDIRQPVSFSLTMGYQVDGARRSDNPSLAGRAPNPTSSGIARADYADLRSYGVGEGFLSTRGVGLSSLETFFAVRFQAAAKITTESMDDLTRRVEVTSPIATWFRESGGELRSGWAEVRDFLPRRLGLSRLRVRAGSQFVYGPWILHLDGINVAYEGPTLTASLYGGPRHTDYTRDDQTETRPVAAGASLRIDLRGLTDAVPIAIAGDYLALSASDETGQPALDTGQLQADWRPSRDIAVIAQMRGVNGKLANQRIEVRTRYQQVTNFVFDLTRRLDNDWLWDPAFSRIGDRLLATQRYLDMGELRPQLIASARAGTLIRENIDLLARIAVASDALVEEQAQTSFTAPYVEIGGAIEVRLRRQAAFALSLLSRQTDRAEVMSPIVDNPGIETGIPIPDVRANTLGEEGFTEIGGILKLTLGARRFSAAVEAYVRNTRYSVVYSDPAMPASVPEDDQRGGGRVTVDAWVGRKIRVFVAYDVSSQLDTAPEISGYKSLRLTLTGIY
jgi:hypothetical protein